MPLCAREGERVSSQGEVKAKSVPAVTIQRYGSHEVHPASSALIPHLRAEGKGRRGCCFSSQKPTAGPQSLQTTPGLHSTIHSHLILVSAFQSLVARQEQRLEHSLQLHFYQIEGFKITNFKQKQRWNPRGWRELYSDCGRGAQPHLLAGTA